jgi:hypothetical protein
MRRNYISPEYMNKTIYGTFNMMEDSNFFASKMLDIEDNILISNQNIIYYQKLTGEQLDLTIESSLPSYIYSASENMKSHHTLIIDESQLNYQKENNTKWILNVDLRNILSDYLFAILKRYRTFEGVSNKLTKTNDINVSIKEYIDKNIINKYKFNKLNLYLSYKDLKNQNLLKHVNSWDQNIISDSNLLLKKQINLKYDYSSAIITFNQEKESNLYNFDYYFSILFQKI